MPARATESASGYRKYRYRGRELVSVTTVLSQGIPKPALMYWAAREVAQWSVDHLEEVTRMVANDPDDAVAVMKNAHNKSKRKAGLKGTEIHALAEAHALGLPLPAMSPDALPFVQPLFAFLDEFKPEPVYTETTAFSPTHGYAGTLDSIADFKQFGRQLLDIKTSKGVYPETALQLSAYAHADFLEVDGAEVPIPKLDGAMVVHISPSGYALFNADVGDETFQYFLACKAVAEFQTNFGNHVLTSI